ncbi:MAG: hypothetical protein Ta2E_06300 [Mycoplasmoidaceae bacterium]|nr:MAG: hypothetical protein Ta2E_06300 [Mycoplasmoidaceae bacterium]
MQQNYYINSITNNTENSHKYVYLDSFDGYVRQENNQWNFDLRFYIIHNSVLPSNIFLMDFETPFAKMSNIQLSMYDFTYIPEFVKLNGLCKVYKTNFSLDVPQQLTNSDINYNISLNTNIHVNQEVLESTSISSNNSVINAFVSDIDEKKINANFQYSNNIELIEPQNVYIQFGNQIYINSKKDYFYIDDGIYIENITGDYDYKKFFKLLNESNNYKTITSINWHYEYTLNGELNERVYDWTENVNKIIVNEYDITFNNKIIFENGNIINNIDGKEGLFIPQKANGRLKISIGLLDQFNNLNYIYINKNLNFSQTQDIKKYISKKTKDINVTNEFRKEKFYD